jgi:hypothetical protein
MPSVAEAVAFVRDPRTTPEQLRRASQLLSLEKSEDTEVIRARLLTYLQALDIDSSVVCLNPRLFTPESA